MLTIEESTMVSHLYFQQELLSSSPSELSCTVKLGKIGTKGRSVTNGYEKDEILSEYVH